ncbi:MAG: flagellar basal body rod protein FlgC [Pseudomonadota bacterium]
MDGLHQSKGISASGMQAQAERLRFITENVANADTPGYQRKVATFEEVLTRGRETGRVEIGSVNLDRSERAQIFDPAHPLANSEGYYEGSNVSLVVELGDAREAQRSYEANLRMFDQARKMRSSLFELLRR